MTQLSWWANWLRTDFEVNATQALVILWNLPKMCQVRAAAYILAKKEKEWGPSAPWASPSIPSPLCRRQRLALVVK